MRSLFERACSILSGLNSKVKLLCESCPTGLGEGNDCIENFFDGKMLNSDNSLSPPQGKNESRDYMMLYLHIHVIYTHIMVRLPMLARLLSYWVMGCDCVKGKLRFSGT